MKSSSLSKNAVFDYFVITGFIILIFPLLFFLIDFGIFPQNSLFQNEVAAMLNAVWLPLLAILLGVLGLKKARNQRAAGYLVLLAGIIFMIPFLLALFLGIAYWISPQRL